MKRASRDRRCWLHSSDQTTSAHRLGRATTRTSPPEQAHCVGPHRPDLHYHASELLLLEMDVPEASIFNAAQLTLARLPMQGPRRPHSWKSSASRRSASGCKRGRQLRLVHEILHHTMAALSADSVVSDNKLWIAPGVPQARQCYGLDCFDPVPKMTILCDNSCCTPSFILAWPSVPSSMCELSLPSSTFVDRTAPSLKPESESPESGSARSNTETRQETCSTVTVPCRTVTTRRNKQVSALQNTQSLSKSTQRQHKKQKTRSRPLDHRATHKQTKEQQQQHNEKQKENERKKQEHKKKREAKEQSTRNTTYMQTKNNTTLHNTSQHITTHHNTQQHTTTNNKETLVIT